MTPEEIQAGNEIIWKYKYPHVVDNRPEARIPYYNGDWNILIPVVKKVMKELLTGNSLRASCTMQMIEIRNALVEMDIDNLFKATVEGIQILNEIKEKEKDDEL